MRIDAIHKQNGAMIKTNSLSASFSELSDIFTLSPPPSSLVLTEDVNL